MTADADDRLSFLVDTLDLLWPGIGSDGNALGRVTVVPNTRAPRLLVPVRPRRAAAGAVRRYTAQQGGRERIAGRALSTLVRVGWCDLLPQATSNAPRAQTIDEYLSQALGLRVVTALALTRERPNRKPVLSVFDARGDLVAFAKIGVSPLAAQLVEAEAEALSHLAHAAPAALAYPAVLHLGRWKELPVMVTSPLAMGNAPRADDPTLADAMRAVSQLRRATVTDYVDAMHARAARAGSTAAPWIELFDELVATRDLSGVQMGSWHGDWTAWNCARRGSTLSVWDWERFAVPAPAGFDMLHFVLNSAVKGRRDRFAPAATDLVADAERLLNPWRLSAETARTTALLYVLDIALRYIVDDLRSTDPGGRVEQWAFPIVRSHLAATTQPEPL